MQKEKVRYIIDAVTKRIIDTASGEVVKDAIPAAMLPRKVRMRGDFIMMFQLAGAAMRELRLTKREYDVFFELVTSMEFENWCDTTPTKIAQLRGMSVTHVCGVLRSLARKGVCSKTATAGGVMRWRMSPEFVWRGKAETHSRTRKELKLVPMQRAASSV